MRAIDADELWEKMYRYSDNEGAKMPYGDDNSLICKDSACFLIENAPTIEPKSVKALRLLVEWAVECGFGFDNIPDEYEKYKDDIADMDGYMDALIYIAEKEVEHEH